MKGCLYTQFLEVIDCDLYKSENISSHGVRDTMY